MNAADLDARAERVLAAARGQPVPVAIFAGDVLFALEAGPVRVVPRESAKFVLVFLGLAKTYREIESGRAVRSAEWLPIVVMLDGLANLRWIESHRMSPGGIA